MSGELPTTGSGGSIIGETAAAGVPAISYGTSYGVATNNLTAWTNKAAAILSTQPLVQRAQAGTRSDQVLAQVESTWAVNSTGVVFYSDGAINDESTDAGDPKGIRSTREATRASWSRITAQYVSGLTDTGLVYSATGWANGVSTAVGAYVDIGFYGDAVEVNYSTSTSAPRTAVVKNSAGTTIGTINSGDFKRAHSGTYRVRGFGPGPHTVRLEVTASPFTFKGYTIPSPSPAQIVWLRAGLYPGMQGTGAARWPRLQTLYGEMQTLAQDYGVLVVDMAQNADWDPATMIGSDKGHMNDLGAATAAKAAAQRIASLPYKQGMNQLTSPTAAPAYVPVAPSSGGGTTPPVVVPPTSTKPDAPAISASTANQISYTVTAPANNGGAAITAYEVRYSVTGVASWTTIANASLSGNVTSGLTEGAVYDFQARAINSVGPSDWTASVTATAGANLAGVYARENFNVDGALAGTTVQLGSGIWEYPRADATVVASKSGGTLTVTGIAAGKFAEMVVDDGHNDGVLYVKLTTDGKGGGLVFRQAAYTTGYVFYRSVSLGGYRLAKIVGGTYTNLKQVVVPLTSNPVLSVDLTQGSTIVCKVDGTEVLRQVDNSYSGTKHGPFASEIGATFDDYQHIA